MSSLTPETGFAQGASGPTEVYDTSPAGLGLSPAYLAPGASASATAGASAVGTLANRPASAGAGGFYYASDQVAFYLYDGSAWQRIGPQAGDIIWTNESSARTGYLICTGQAWPGTTGIYADLYGKWGGATLPDFQARMFAAKGTHADVSTLLNNDGVAVANRRPKHRHTHTLAISGGSHAHNITYGNGGFNLGNPGGTDQGLGTSATYATAAATHTHPNGEFSGTIGNSVNDPLDADAYIVLQPQVKL